MILNDVKGTRYGAKTQTVTVDGTVANINWQLGTVVYLDLRTSTGNVTVNLTNPLSLDEYSSGYMIQVTDHATFARTLTFPAGTRQPDAGSNTYTAPLQNTQYFVFMEHSPDHPVNGDYYSFNVLTNVA